MACCIDIDRDHLDKIQSRFRCMTTDKHYEPLDLARAYHRAANTALHDANEAAAASLLRLTIGSLHDAGTAFDDALRRKSRKRNARSKSVSCVPRPRCSHKRSTTPHSQSPNLSSRSSNDHSTRLPANTVAEIEAAAVFTTAVRQLGHDQALNGKTMDIDEISDALKRKAEFPS